MNETNTFFTVMSIVHRCRNLSEYMKLAEKVKEFFHNEGIHSTTIQPEFVEIGDVSFLIFEIYSVWFTLT